MRKKITIFICAAMATAMVSLGGCGFNVQVGSHSSSSQTKEQTVDGITRTETTSTVNGEEKTTVKYVKDGKVMDEEDGAAAFGQAVARHNGF